MSRQWVVTLQERGNVFGPFDDEESAKFFAAFLTAEVDPATAHPLRDPCREAMAWYNAVARPKMRAARQAER